MNAELSPELVRIGLYIHVPWCVRKCPYCDFNSHASAPEFDLYVTRLLEDLEHELENEAACRPVTSIFIGGGTPSLLPGNAICRLLAGIRERTLLLPDAEITLEANPGTIRSPDLDLYREAGINRLSIGVQSLSAHSLQRLGRIHTPEEAIQAVASARASGFEFINIDLMFGLPDQDLAGVRQDLEAALSLETEHLSFYELTLEPGTAFFRNPPSRPDEDLIADMAEMGRERLRTEGYLQYEVSAFSRPGHQCRHNLGYWKFHDYLGIGAGAHGKLTCAAQEDGDSWQITRAAKKSSPQAYLSGVDHFIDRSRKVGEDERIFEFALNAMRLTQGSERGLFQATTGLDESRILPGYERACELGLLEVTRTTIRPTTLGRNFLNDLINCFGNEA